MRHFFREMPLRWPKVCLEPDYLAAILIAAWPFAFLWVYVFDVLSIGNDFAGLYYNYKIYLLTSLREGHFPLWSPGEAAGLPFVSNPYNQPFYPLNLIYYLYFILLNRFSEWDYTLFTISGLSIFGLGLYFWLRRLLRSVPGPRRCPYRPNESEGHRTHTISERRSQCGMDAVAPPWDHARGGSPTVPHERCCYRRFNTDASDGRLSILHRLCLHPYRLVCCSAVFSTGAKRNSAMSFSTAARHVDGCFDRWRGLAFGLTFFLRLLENAKEKRGDALHFLIAIGVASAAALAAQSFMVHNSVLSGYWSDYFKLGVVSKSIDFGLAGRWLRGFDERFFPLMTLVSFGVLAGLVLVSGQRRVARPAALVVVLLVALLDLYPVSSFQWPYRLTPMPAQASVERMLRAAYDRPRVIGPGTIDPFSGTQNVGLLDNWDFQRHAAVYLRYFNRDGLPLASVNAETISAVKRFYGADEHAQRLFLSSTIAHSGIGTFMGDVEALGARSNPKMRVMGYNGDTIDIEVKVDQPGWLSFIDNWDPNWVATIDDRTVPIERLFGSYKSVAVPAGLSLITFSYRPPWFGWLP